MSIRKRMKLMYNRISLTLPLFLFVLIIYSLVIDDALLFGVSYSITIIAVFAYLFSDGKPKKVQKNQ